MNVISFNEKVNPFVGAYLRRKRIALGLSGTELGRLLHVSQQQISRYECGVTPFTLKYLLYCLKKMNIGFEEFFVELIKNTEGIDLNLKAELRLQLINELPPSNMH